MLECKNLKISIGGKEHIYSFFAKEGEITVILGLNGIGKTTILKHICGIVEANGGEILFKENDLLKVSKKQRSKIIAYLPQKTLNLNELKVLSYVLTGRTPYISFLGTPQKVDRDIAENNLRVCKVHHLKNRVLNTLSGGEHRKVSMAKTLTQETPLFILDEPTANLDFKSAYNFMQQLKMFGKQNNKTIILTLHDPNLALKYADHFIILDENGVKGQFQRAEKSLDFALEELYDMGVVTIENEKLLLPIETELNRR